MQTTLVTGKVHLPIIYFMLNLAYCFFVLHTIANKRPDLDSDMIIAL